MHQSFLLEQPCFIYVGWSFFLWVTKKDRKQSLDTSHQSSGINIIKLLSPTLTWSELCPRLTSHCRPQLRLWLCWWGTSRPTWEVTGRSPVTEWPAGSPGHRNELFLSSLPPLTEEDNTIYPYMYCVLFKVTHWKMISTCNGHFVIFIDVISLDATLMEMEKKNWFEWLDSHDFEQCSL